jgi:hypothetical protein
VSNLPNIGLVLGIVLLALGTWGIRFSWRRVSTKSRYVLLVIAVGCAVAVIATGEYRPSATERYIGFPFLSVAFIKRGEVWLDYLGPLTIPALLANAYVGFTLPFIAASVRLFARSRRGA